MRWTSCGRWETQAIRACKKACRSPRMSFLPPSGGVVRLAPPRCSGGGPGRVFHADGRSVLKVQTGRRKQKSLHKQTGKTLPSREASSSVLCSDSICSKTAPIALNALRIEPKYLYDLIFHIQLFSEYIMDLRGMSTTFYDSKAISARCSRTDWKFRQNAKYDEISGRKTRVIYLCSAEGKRLADGCKRIICQPLFLLVCNR